MTERSGSNITSLLGLLGFAWGGAFGCRKPAMPPIAPVVVDAGPAALAPVVDAGPGALPTAHCSASWDGGLSELPLADRDAGISPRSTFRFTTAVQLEDCRARLLDDDDRMLPSHAVLSVDPDGGTVATLELTVPLPARQCCRLRIDGERGELPAAADGRAYLPFEVRFRVWPEPAAPLEAGHHRHRRHRRRPQR